MLSPKFELSPIKAMEIAASKVPNVISLAQGIPSFPTPQIIKDFVKEKIDQGLCDKYSLTIGLAELREEISLALAKENLNYDAETEIFATAGSIEGITAAILASTQPDDEIILPSPSYVSYQGAVGIARCRPIFAPLDEDNNFDFHVEAIERAITKRTRAILYSSPNNPTGTLFSEEKTRALAELAERHNIRIIVDEVYKDFYYSGEKHFSPASIQGMRQRVIRVCSFSKAFAMTGWRIGFVHTDKEILREMLKYHDAMVTCAPVVSQYAAIAALRYGQPYMEDFRAEFKRRRDFTVKMLDSMSQVLDYQLPKAAYFAFPRIKDTVPLARDSMKLAYDILEKAALALVPGVAFGPSGESHLRISFGREMHEVEEGLNRLAGYFLESRKIARAVKSNVEAKKPFLRTLSQLGLAKIAKIYLRKEKPLIIGIAGLRGKTVIKRTISDLLSKQTRVRSSLLSYNTAIGFPLSVLGLHPPVSNLERILLPFRALMQFFERSAPILVLEYGIGSVEDAAQLLDIARPDWLVLTDISNADASLNIENVAAGIKHLASRVNLKNILWAPSDPLLTSLDQNFDRMLCLDSENVQHEKSRHAIQSAIANGKIVGQSAEQGTIAAFLLAAKLNLEVDQLADGL